MAIRPRNSKTDCMYIIKITITIDYQLRYEIYLFQICIFSLFSYLRLLYKFIMKPYTLIKFDANSSI